MCIQSRPPSYSQPSMHPPRISTLLLHHNGFRTTISSRHAYNATRSSTRLLSTTTTSPSLIKTINIPAPNVGHVRVLSLNSPHNRNAISRQLLSELSLSIDTVKAQVEDEAAKGEVVGHGTRVLVLASEVDECFCAGADLKERRRMSKEETNDFLRGLRSTLNTLSALPIPTISCISSVALGGGLELALATNIRVMASSATVGLPETRLAIVPGAGGTYRLRNLIGEAAALELVLTGRRIHGKEASRLGICERLVLTDENVSNSRAKEQVLDAALEMAGQICEGGPGAVMAALRAVRGGREEAENEEYEGVLAWEDRDEALRAFGEKRGPKFTGRRKSMEGKG
ncbi:hypothetical protein N7G274_007747 [Stereocaulon virgatum]|uniref:Methylglutaconyl-CoA hydratase n=1 Tax=Stereocaulon virgatum TaxID=373712 RepID=A0ABR4A214_9LECA